MQMVICEKSFPKKGNSQSKGSKARVCLVFWSKSKETSDSGGVRRREGK